MTLDAADRASDKTQRRGTLYDTWARRVLRLGADASIDHKALTEAIEAARPATMRKKDPFTKLVTGDRTGERVVFEDDAFMLLHDRFASGLKLLCVPKREVLFLSDLDSDEREALEALVAAAVASIAEHTGAPRVDAWVNPPSGLSVRQLHVHIQPVGAKDADLDATYAALAGALSGTGDAKPAPSDVNQEVELKFGVHQDKDLAAIVEACAAERIKIVEQENAFFDDAEGALDKALVAVRIRTETVVREGERSAPSYELTLKGPLKSDGELTIKREEEWDLTAEGAKAALETACCPLTLVKGEPPRKGGETLLIPKIFELSPKASLHLVGTFKNVREKAAANIGGHDVILELDTTTFPSGRTQHELEVEAPNAAAANEVRAALMTIFADAGIETFAQSSKAARFFAEVRAGIVADASKS